MVSTNLYFFLQWCLMLYVDWTGIGSPSACLNHAGRWPLRRPAAACANRRTWRTIWGNDGRRWGREFLRSGGLEVHKFNGLPWFRVKSWKWQLMKDHGEGSPAWTLNAKLALLPCCGSMWFTVIPHSTSLPQKRNLIWIRLRVWGCFKYFASFVYYNTLDLSLCINVFPSGFNQNGCLQTGLKDPKRQKLQVKLVFPDELGLLLGDHGWFPGALGYRFIFEASTQNVERYVLLDTMPQASLVYMQHVWPGFIFWLETNWRLFQTKTNLGFYQTRKRTLFHPNQCRKSSWVQSRSPGGGRIGNRRRRARRQPNRTRPWQAGQFSTRSARVLMKQQAKKPLECLQNTL